MKVRIGMGLGTQTLAGDAERFAGFVDALEQRGFDSLWLSERLTGPAPDPLVALAVAAGRTRKLKLGTSVLVVPGRNPVVLAKELASLDRLSGGRLLPGVGLGAPVPAEHRAFGVERTARAGLFDEAVTLMRRLWTEDDVHHDGEHFHVDGVTLLPRPVQQPIDVWLGGTAPSELRRTGRLGDGWLPSFTVPGRGRGGLGDASPRWRPQHDRAIEPEHLGVLVHLHPGRAARRHRRRWWRRAARARPPRRGARRASTACGASSSGSSRVGASKFVVVPLADPADWDAELDELAEDAPPAGDLTNPIRSVARTS